MRRPTPLAALIPLALLALAPYYPVVEGQQSLRVDVSVRVEPPLIKYYINISLEGDLQQPAPVSIEGPQIICTAPSDVRLQLVSPSSYIAVLQGRGGLIICASTGIEISNGTLQASIYPVSVGGEVQNISRVWLPYYLVNVEASPKPREILPSQDSGYILGFDTNETISMRARVFPYPRELARELQQTPNTQEGSYSSTQQAELQAIVYAGLASLGWLAGYLSSKALPILRSRLGRRNLEREIIDLLSRNPKGMSLSLISKTINAPKSSTWKKLKKLVEEGVVEEFEGPGKGKLYRLRREAPRGSEERAGPGPSR